MKTHLSLIFFIVLFSSSVHAQQGNTRSYPIEVGTYNSEFDYSDSQNTEDFTNNYTGRPSNDVFYKFTINTRMKVIMKHCESELSDTYLSLLDASGKLIDYNDDADFSMGCGGGAGEAYLSKILDAGTYYVVAEGYEENGVITTQITGMFLSSEGDDAEKRHRPEKQPPQEKERRGGERVKRPLKRGGLGEIHARLPQSTMS